MSVDKPLVTIGVPVYNGAKYVIETLNSINNQSYSNIELFIIDDGSSDESYRLCKNWTIYSRFPVSIQKNIKNLGVTATCNIILNQSNGKYLQLFAQDDIMLPEKINNDVEIFEQADEDVALIYSKVKLIDEKGDFLNQSYNERIGFDGVIKQNAFAELIKHNFIPAPTLMLRTHVVKRVGGYDEDLLYEDWDMCLKLARDYKLFFADYTNVYYRIHPGSAMANKETTQKIVRNNSLARMIKKHLGYGKNYDEMLYDKLKELSVYSYFLGDNNAYENLRWYLQNRFDMKVWLYHKLASAGIRHPSLILKSRL